MLMPFAKFIELVGLKLRLPICEIFHLFTRLFILFYFRSEKFQTSVNGKKK